MSRYCKPLPARLRLLPVVAMLALVACGNPEPPPVALDPPPAVPAGQLAQDVLPQPAERMPAEGMEPDGRTAPWSLGAQVGATLQALAKACGADDRPDLQQMHEQQREAVVAAGVDPARFDVVWNWAYRQARQKIALQPSAELERGCESLHQMPEDAGRMGTLLQPMTQP